MIAELRDAKLSTITIGTGSHACTEIETNAFFRHQSQARAPNDDDVPQHGGRHGFQHISSILDIHVVVN